jgi:hypothetical protein
MYQLTVGISITTVHRCNRVPTEPCLRLGTNMQAEVVEGALLLHAVRYAATAGPHRVRRNALSLMIGAARNLGPPTHAH